MTMIIFVKLVVAAMTKMAKITTSSHKFKRILHGHFIIITRVKTI